MGNTFAVQKSANLSDNSKEDTDPKKAKEATSSSSYSNCYVFEEGLDSSNCRNILFDCLKIFESKVNEIFVNQNTLKENQLKGEHQLTGLAETVNFLSEKFHEFEAHRKLKEKIIKTLHGQVSVLRDYLKKWKHNWTSRHNMLVGIALSFMGEKKKKAKTLIALSLIWLRKRWI